jgi:hypothetical protein
MTRLGSLSAPASYHNNMKGGMSAIEMVRSSKISVWQYLTYAEVFEVNTYVTSL